MSSCGRRLIAGGALVLACAAPAMGAGTAVTIADVGTTASQLGADMSARALGAQGFTVTRVSQASAVAADGALRAGTIDVYVTDTATLLERVLARPKQRAESALRTEIAAGVAGRGAVAIGITPSDDAPTVACTRRAVKAFGITGMLKLPAIAPKLSYGATPAHMVRADGYFALAATFRRVIVRTGSGRFGLFTGRRVHCVHATLAEPRAARLGLVTTRDTTRRLAGTPRHGVSVVSSAYLASAPAQFPSTVESVAALVTTPVLTGLRGSVEIDGKPAASVADEFLRANRVIP